MKKLLSILVLFFSLTLSAQTPYVAAGLSIGEGNFGKSSYPSLEAGVTLTGLSVGAVFGRGSFTGAFSDSDVIESYWWEFKVSPYISLSKNITATVFVGIGSYVNTSDTFSDIGVGLSYSIGNFSYGVAFNQWDEVNYVSPSVTYSFD